MAYVYAACTVRVTIFSAGGKFSNFTELHVLTQAACSYVLLGMSIASFLLFVVHNIIQLLYETEKYHSLL